MELHPEEIKFLQNLSPEVKNELLQYFVENFLPTANITPKNIVSGEDNYINPKTTSKKCMIIGIGNDNDQNTIEDDCTSCIIYGGKNNKITKGTTNSRILNCNGITLYASNCLVLTNTNGETEYINL